MTPSDIKQAIFAVLAKIAPEADLANLPGGDNLREALDLDSFDFLNFLIGLNQKLAVEIPESDYGKLATLNDLIGYLGAASSSARTAPPRPESS